MGSRSRAWSCYTKGFGVLLHTNLDSTLQEQQGVACQSRSTGVQAEQGEPALPPHRHVPEPVSVRLVAIEVMAGA